MAGESPIRIRTPFDPQVHGFPFPNCFAVARPTLVLDLFLGKIRIGDASKGLCGGMVFAAEDYRRAGRAVPRSIEEPGFYDYLCERLRDSFSLPVGPIRIFNWMLRPDRSSRFARSVAFLTRCREWPKVRAHLHRAPVPIMLIKVAAWNPLVMGENHQVLAHGYDFDPATGRVVLSVYDPNYPLTSPGDDQVTLTFNLRDLEGKRIVHSREGESVRGFFMNHYSLVVPPTTS